MKRLYDSAKNSRNKVMFEVEGGDHNLTWMRAGESYPIKVREFIETCLTY